MRALDLPEILRAAGCDVVEVAGWRTRGRELRGIRGGVTHHTATASSRAGDYPTLGLVRDGRSDLPGPLAQLGLGRSGRWYVIASGRANHAGVVHRGFAGTHANDYALGVEAEHPGRGAWPRAQYDAYVRGCAALSRAYGITWYGHKEVAAPAGRKVDPTFDMDLFRAAVTAAAASLARPGGGSLPTVPTGTLPDPLDPTDPEDTMRIYRRGRTGSAILVAAGCYQALTDAEVAAWDVAGISTTVLPTEVFETIVGTLVPGQVASWAAGFGRGENRVLAGEMLAEARRDSAAALATAQAVAGQIARLPQVDQDALLAEIRTATSRAGASADDIVDELVDRLERGAVA